MADVHTFCLEQDNSEREWYADAFTAVPDHWLKYEDYVNTGDFPIDILITIFTLELHQKSARNAGSAAASPGL